MYIEKILDENNAYECFWQALSLAIFVFIIFSPPMFSLTSFLSYQLCLPQTTACGRPTVFGLVLHAFLIFIVFLFFPVYKVE